MKNLALISVAALAIWLASDITEAYPKGAPDSVCLGLVPSPRKHKATPSDKASPYTLDVHVDKDRLKLTLSGTPEFRGFALQLRRKTDNELAGEFEWNEETAENVRYMKCDPNEPKSSITQSKSHRRDQIQVDWIWPAGSTPADGDYNITFTVVTNRKHFWVKTAPMIFSKDSQL